MDPRSFLDRGESEDQDTAATAPLTDLFAPESPPGHIRAHFPGPSQQSAEAVLDAFQQTGHVNAEMPSQYQARSLSEQSPGYFHDPENSFGLPMLGLQTIVRNEVAREMRQTLPYLHAAAVQLNPSARQGAEQAGLHGPARIPDEAVSNMFQRMDRQIRTQEAHLRDQQAQLWSQQAQIDALERRQQINTQTLNSIDRRVQLLEFQTRPSYHSPYRETVVGNADAQSAPIPPRYQNLLGNQAQEEAPVWTEHIARLAREERRAELSRLRNANQQGIEAWLDNTAPNRSVPGPLSTHNFRPNTNNPGLDARLNTSVPSRNVPDPFPTHNLRPITVWVATESPFPVEMAAGFPVPVQHTSWTGGSGLCQGVRPGTVLQQGHTVGHGQPNCAGVSAPSQSSTGVTQAETDSALGQDSFPPTSEHGQ